MRDDAPKEFEELVINIDRVSRVVKGGRRFRFKALVVVGNRKDKVGVGVAKGADVQAAVAKATSVAKKHLITLPLNGETIPHDSEVNSLRTRIDQTCRSWYWYYRWWCSSSDYRRNRCP